MTAGAGSGAAGAGSRVAGADEAVRRGAGSARRGGRGLGRGALTVTSGRVSDIWPQTASTPVKAPDDASALSAAARNKRRFAAASRDASRPSPPAPRMAPTGKFPSNSGTSAGSGSHEVLPIPIGNIWQCGRGDTPCRRPPGCPPRTSGRLPGTSPARRPQSSRRRLEHWRRSWVRASRVWEEYYVISIESEDVNMRIRKNILMTLAITLIATAPAWSAEHAESARSGP